ncbi:MAG: PqqD family protein [Planctomycetota bacterium]
MADLDACYAKTDRFTSRTVEGVTVLIPAGDLDELDNLYPLNKTGARLWALIDGATSLRGMAEKIAEEFNISSEQVQEDVAAFIRQLGEIGAVMSKSGG